MGLYVIATPIGNDADISLHALEILKSADLVIGEERKATAQRLKTYEIRAPQIDLLNEHSDSRDLEFLLNECRIKKVALISDCGTPGFCDPGQDLVKACRRENIEVCIVPGASSLMAFLSGCGERIDEFYFKGFLPAKSPERESAWRELVKIAKTTIVMDTPYRLERMMTEVHQYFPEWNCILGLRLTQKDEKFYYGKAKNILKEITGIKAEFILLIQGQHNKRTKR